MTERQKLCKNCVSHSGIMSGNLVWCNEEKGIVSAEHNCAKFAYSFADERRSKIETRTR